MATTEKGQNNEEKAQKLAEEDMGRIYEEHKSWLLEKKALDEKAVVLTAEAEPSEDEPDDTKDLKTRAELVAHF